MCSPVEITVQNNVYCKLKFTSISDVVLYLRIWVDRIGKKLVAHVCKFHKGKQNKGIALLCGLTDACFTLTSKLTRARVIYHTGNHFN